MIAMIATKITSIVVRIQLTMRIVFEAQLRTMTIEAMSPINAAIIPDMTTVAPPAIPIFSNAPVSVGKNAPKMKHTRILRKYIRTLRSWRSLFIRCKVCCESFNVM